MNPFTKLAGPAAPLPESNIDTDVIYPARFLLIMEKQGIGRHLFHERRHGEASGSAPFVLDRPPFDRAQILLAGANFGVGSSREHAVWALADFGIRCVIAPSFGEIFYSNCFKNGVLPIVLDAALVERMFRLASDGASFTVDLETSTVTLPDGEAIVFEVDPYRRRALLLGLDEIGEILEDDAETIRAFETRRKAEAPWLFLDADRFDSFDDIDRRDLPS